MTDEQIIASEAWQAFVQMRKEKKKGPPMTELAQRRILSKLRMFHEDGQDVQEVLWTSFENRWDSVYPIRRSGWAMPRSEPTVTSESDRHTAAYLASLRLTPDQREAADIARKVAMEKIGRLA